MVAYKILATFSRVGRASDMAKRNLFHEEMYTGVFITRLAREFFRYHYADFSWIGSVSVCEF